MHLGQATGEGPLDKAIIRRYIKRNLQKIQSCYDKELLASPGLAGTVTVTFEIGVDGGVASSIGTGLANVDACVAGVIKGIEFPKPAAVTKVNYPFEFSPSGAEQP